MKEWMQNNLLATVIMALMATIIAVLYANLQTAQKQLDAERSCEKSPICLDGRASWGSIAEDFPLQSRTGRWFFQGNACATDCQSMVAGYRYAERLGATRSSACSHLNQEAAQGCMAFVGDSDTPMPSDEYGSEPQ